MSWKLTWRGKTYTEDDVIGADLFTAEVVTPDGLFSADPTRGWIHAANLFAILAARIDGRDFQEVVGEIAAAPASEVAGLVGVWKEAGQPSAQPDASASA